MSTPLTNQNVNSMFTIHQIANPADTGDEEVALPARSNLFSLVWVQQGIGRYWVDTKEYPLISNAVYGLYPGKLTLFDNAGELDGYVISFTPEFLGPMQEGLRNIFQSGLFSLYGVHPVILQGEGKPDMEGWLDNLLCEYNQPSEHNEEAIRALLKVIVIRLSRLLQAQAAQKLEEGTSPRDVEQVTAFLQLVQKNFTTMKKVSGYARLLGLSPNYLNVKVKKISGFSASYHIQQCILLEAKRQVKWKGMSLKEIAYQLGYDDLAYFSKFFKKAAGVSFSHYKRQPSS